MFTTRTLLPAVFVSYALYASAQVVPNEPAPGDTFNEGATCSTAWGGDPSGTQAWKNMSIQLMTGSNDNMVPLTTVATGQDGTAAGSFQYTCPSVTINSAIYFYQYSAPGAGPTTLEWTGRFIIASTTGNSVPPPNAVEPDGSDKPWGTGALTDPSTAVPPPAYLSSTTTTGANTTTGTNSTSSSTNGTSVSASIPPSVPTSAPASVIPTSVPPTNTSIPAVVPSNNNSPSSAASSAPSTTPSSAAMGPLKVDTSLIKAAVVLAAASAGFAMLL